MDKLFVREADGTFEPAKAETIMAAGAATAEAELVRRGAELEPDTLKPLVLAFLAGRDHELMVVAYLDALMRLIEMRVEAEGDVVSVEIPIREIVKRCLTNTAVNVVMIHNHPGSIARPSEADKKVSSLTKLWLALFHVRMVDNWVVAGDKVWMASDHEEPPLPPELKALAQLLKLTRGNDHDD